MRGLIPWLVTISATGIFACLAAYSLARYSSDHHEAKSYSQSQVKEVEGLIEPDLVRPKTKRDRARIIAKLWGLEAGSLEIARLK